MKNNLKKIKNIIKFKTYLGNFILKFCKNVKRLLLII